MSRPKPRPTATAMLIDSLLGEPIAAIGPPPYISLDPMRILYGVVGEGMGHATRSRVILEELVKEHEVHIVVSGRARDYLAKRFENVHNIWGFTINYADNSVSKWQTILQNLKGAVTGWPQNVKQY